MPKYFRQFRILLWSIMAFTFGFLLWQGIVPLGRISYQRDFSHESKFIKEIKPLDRTLPPYAGLQTVLGGPVYFNLHTPRKFEQATITIKYRLSPNFQQGLIELGTLVDNVNWQYRLAPLENQALDKILNKWPKLQEGDLTLLQRKKTYDSMADFLKNPPELTRLATYNYDLNRPFVMPSYSPSNQPLEINQQFLGSYQILAYAQDEQVNFTFDFKDSVTAEKSQAAKIYLYGNDKLLRTIELNKERQATSTEAGPWRLDIKEKAQGAVLYRLELRAGKSVVTTKIQTSLGKVAFRGSLLFATENKGNIKLFTDSKELNILALNSLSLGQVRIGTTTQAVEEAYKQYTFRASQPLSEVTLEKPGLQLAGDGLFAFSPEAIFNPQMKKINHLTDFERDGIDYVLARYQAPEKSGEWTEASATFDLRGTAQEKGDYKFIISVPGFKADDRQLDYLDIKEIKVELQGKTLWQYARSLAKRGWNYLFFD